MGPGSEQKELQCIQGFFSSQRGVRAKAGDVTLRTGGEDGDVTAWQRQKTPQVLESSALEQLNPSIQSPESSKTNNSARLAPGFRPAGSFTRFQDFLLLVWLGEELAR